TSLALGPLGQPHISYQDGTGFDLLYATGPQELLAVPAPRPTAPGRDLRILPNPSVLGVTIRLQARAGGVRAMRLFDVAGAFGAPARRGRRRSRGVGRSQPGRRVRPPGRAPRAPGAPRRQHGERREGDPRPLSARDARALPPAAACCWQDQVTALDTTIC